MSEALRVKDLLELLRQEDPDSRVAVRMMVRYSDDNQGMEDSPLIGLRREMTTTRRVVLEGE